MLTSFGPAYQKTAALLGLISLLLIIPVHFFLPDLKASIIGLLTLGLLLLLSWGYVSRKTIASFLAGRRAKHLLLSLAMVLVFLALLVLVNVLGIIRPYRFDWTDSGNYTLSPQTIRVIKNLTGPVKAIGFFPDDASSAPAKQKARELLEEYRYWNNRFSFLFIDPEAKPDLADRYRVRSHGTIVFEGLGRQKAVQEATEQNFTGALLEITGVQAKKVYFLTGNGEHDPSSEEPEGYGQARRGLIRDLYKVHPLNLTQTGEIPGDCAVLILAGIKKAMPPASIGLLKNYLNNHGKALFLLDPDPPQDIKDLLSDWGLTTGQGQVVDPGAYVSPDVSIPAVFKGQYPSVVITRNLDTTYFPSVLSLFPNQDLSRIMEAMQEQGRLKSTWPLQPIQFRNLAILPAVISTPESRLEKSEDGSGSSKTNKGPQALGVMVIADRPLGKVQEPARSEKKEKLTRLIVFGDSDFSANRHIHNGGNGDLFLNAVNWLAEEEQLISIRPKPYSFRRLLVNENELRFIRYTSLGFLPLILLIIGGILWWKKR
ncbi:MAG: GldG family protein [Thermodesulfobacteriota bacterium]